MECNRTWTNIATPAMLDIQIVVNGTMTTNGGIAVSHPDGSETELPLSALPLSLSPKTRYEVITAFAAVGNGGTVVLNASVTGKTPQGPAPCIMSVKPHQGLAKQITTVVTA